MKSIKRTNVDPLDLMVAIAHSYLGRSEYGNNRGDWVDELNRKAGAPVGSPWCASFVGGVVNEVAEKLGLKSQLLLSPHVKTLFNQNKKYRAEFPAPGLIACWGIKDSTNGHCGIVCDVDPKGEWYRTIEGNSDDKTTIEREGGMVVLQRRPIGDLGIFRQLGFLKAF